jgi:DNA-binding response OmpR family regulator
VERRSDGRMVLIVDDDAVLCDGLSVLLTDHGYRTAVAPTGAAAIDHARRGPPPGAAVVDIHLPDINGLVLSQRLREHLGSAAPIIVLSGDTSMEVLNSLPHMGATYFFGKPVHPETLLERLARLLPPLGPDPPVEPDPPNTQ